MGNEYRKSLKKLFKELESEQGARSRPGARDG